MILAIDFWYWWVLSTVLIIIEILAPTFFAMWMAIAAFLTGVALLLIPALAWEYQIMMFAVLSVMSIMAWRHHYKKHPIETDEPLLNRRGEQYIGREITLKMPIEDGRGKVQLDDSTWKVEGEDCPAGNKVKITALNNVVFKVETVKD